MAADATPSEPDFSTFPVKRRGSYFEKFEIGQVFEHHWGRTLGTSDNTLFSTSLAHWSPMYLNSEYAKQHGHPGPVVNPFLVLCTVVGLSVEDLSESGGPFLGIEECVFERPVYEGDTLKAQSTVIDSRPSASRPGHGIVTWKTSGSNQHGETVVHFIRKNLLTSRSAA